MATTIARQRLKPERTCCDGPKAAITGTALTVDDHGFIAQMWKQMDTD